MDTTKINSITDVFDLFEKTLAEGVEKLQQADRVTVERLFSIPDDNYMLKPPKGTYGIMNSGTNYSKRDSARVTQLDQDILMSVVSIIRFTDNGMQTVDKVKRFGMMPAEYPDYAVDLLTGIEIFSTRPVADRKIIPIKTDLVNEKNGLWIYVTTFSVPKDFIELNLRQK